MRFWLIVALGFVVFFAKKHTGKNLLNPTNKLDFTFNAHTTDILEELHDSVPKSALFQISQILSGEFNGGKKWKNGYVFDVKQNESYKKLLFLVGESQSMLMLLCKKSANWHVQDTLSFDIQTPTQFKPLNKNLFMVVSNENSYQTYHLARIVEDALVRAAEIPGSRFMRKGYLVTDIMTCLVLNEKSEDIDLQYDIRLIKDSIGNMMLCDTLFYTNLKHNYVYSKEQKEYRCSYMPDGIQNDQIAYLKKIEDGELFFKAFNNEINIIFECGNQQQRDRLLVIKSLISNNAVLQSTDLQ